MNRLRNTPVVDQDKIDARKSEKAKESPQPEKQASEMPVDRRQRAIVRMRRPYQEKRYQYFVALSEIPNYCRDKQLLPAGCRAVVAEEDEEYPNFFMRVTIESPALRKVPENEPLPTVNEMLEPMTDTELQTQAAAEFEKVKPYHRCPICWQGRKGKALRKHVSWQRYGAAKTRVSHRCDTCGHVFAYLVTTTRILERADPDDDSTDLDLTDGGTFEPKILGN